MKSSASWQVAGSNGNRYIVRRVDNKWTCTCPAGAGHFKKGRNTHGKHCKHIKQQITTEKGKGKEAVAGATAAAEDSASTATEDPAQLRLMLWGANGMGFDHLNTNGGRGGAVAGTYM